MATLKLFESGIYSVPEAAKLVGATERKVRGWIVGYDNGADPLIENQLGWIDGRLTFSFVNLMEVRFIKCFADAGISLPHIRAILTEARELMNHPHPFATRTVFRTDGKKILADIAKKNGIDELYDLKTHNYAMRPMVFDSLKTGVEYDPQGHARLWQPRPQFPHVIVHPKFAFGHPVLRDSRIPTRALRAAVKAEGSAEAVAEQFEVPLSQVREADKFERELKMAA